MEWAVALGVVVVALVYVWVLLRNAAASPGGIMVDMLLKRNDVLVAAIRKHRDASGHDRCWLNDVELYKLLPETPPDSPGLPSREEFARRCAEYYDQQAGSCQEGCHEN